MADVQGTRKHSIRKCVGGIERRVDISTLNFFFYITCLHTYTYVYTRTYSVAEEILKLRRELYYGEQGAGYGERGIPVTEMIEVINAVFRITVDHPNGG